RWVRWLAGRNGIAMIDRLTHLRERMAKANLDAFLVGAPVEDIFHTHAANRRYLSGFTGSMGWLLVTSDAAFIAVDFRYVEQAERESPHLTVLRTTGGVDKWLPNIVRAANLSAKRIGFEPGEITVASCQTIKKAAGAMPHAQPRDHPIDDGDTIVIDMGVIVDGYCADLTRTIPVGKPAGKFYEIYVIVLPAQRTAEELIRTGMTGEEAHMLAHNVIAESGFGDDFAHGLGHGVGLLIHDAPRLARLSNDEPHDGLLATTQPATSTPGCGAPRL